MITFVLVVSKPDMPGEQLSSKVLLTFGAEEQYKSFEEATIRWAEQYNRLHTASDSTLVQDLQSAPSSNCRRKGRAVVVVANEGGDEYGLSHIKQGDEFPSAQFLSSMVFKFKYNAAAQYLSQARFLKDKSATIRGIIFCYKDDYNSVMAARAEAYAKVD